MVEVASSQISSYAIYAIFTARFYPFSYATNMVFTSKSIDYFVKKKATHITYIVFQTKIPSIIMLLLMNIRKKEKFKLSINSQLDNFKYYDEKN